MATPRPQFSLTLRVESPQAPGTLGKVTAAITEVGPATVADEELAEDYVIPSVLNREVSREVARAVAEEAERAGPVREPTTTPPSCRSPSFHRG